MLLITMPSMVTIDYALPLEQLLKSFGCKVAEHSQNPLKGIEFPLVPRKKITQGLSMTYLASKLWGSDVVTLFEARGYRPASMVELVAFTSVNKEVARRFSPVALGFHDMKAAHLESFRTNVYGSKGFDVSLHGDYGKPRPTNDWYLIAQK